MPYKLRSALTAALMVAPMISSATAMPGQGTWETTLEARDLNHDGVTDAFYDKTLNLTWLASLGRTQVEWTTANAWAQSLQMGGQSGWRLPKVTPTSSCTYSAAGGTDCGANVNLFDLATGHVASEVAHLWYVTLGNKAYAEPSTGMPMQQGWGLSNTAQFQNMTDATLLWSNANAADTTLAWYFDLGLGTQNVGRQYFSMAALAVHDGDVAAVPEASALGMAFGGLALIWGVRRRQRRSRS
jgi:hypothetical protein